MNRARGLMVHGAIACVVINWAIPAYGQWMEQTIDLRIGWNSVFVEVDPSPESSDLLFGGKPIETVWMRAADPLVSGPPVNCLGSEDPNCRPKLSSLWRVWVPAGDPGRPVSNLPTMRGGRAYLIKATAVTTLTLVGKPSAKVTQWRAGFNHAGFHIDPEAPPTFDAYLSASPVHAGTSIYKKKEDGTLDPITNLGEPIAAGTAYWVKTTGDLEYGGPIEIDIHSRTGIAFGRTQTEHSLSIKNLATAQRTVSLDYVPSMPVPAEPTDLPELAGDVPLMWFEAVGGDIAVDENGELVNDIFVWHDFSSEPYPHGKIAPFPTAGQPGARKTITLGVNRLAVGGGATLDPDDDGIVSEFQGLVAIRDGAGFRRFLSVSTEVPTGGPLNSNGSSASPPGLWVGNVTLNQVAWTTAGSRVWTNSDEASNDDFIPIFEDPTDADNTAMRPTSSELFFPVIIHVDENSEGKMLTEVTLMREPNEPDSPLGDLVLVTSTCADCDDLEPGGTSNGQPFSPRISTAAYAFDGELGLNLSGGFETGDAAWAGEIVIEPDHALNPFMHKFHPDHDCDNPGECYRVTRAFVFVFDAAPPEGVIDLDWGSGLLTGTYHEVITISANPGPAGCACDGGSSTCVGSDGLDGEPCTTDEDCGCGDENLYVTEAAGPFQLTRVSEIATLNR